MLQTVDRASRIDSDEPLRRRRELMMLGVAIFLLLVVGTRVSEVAPTGAAIAYLGLILACVTCLVRPIIGIYLCVFFTLVGDASTTPWWPFTKNLSSRESVMFLADGLSINPLEILLATTTVGFILMRLVDSSSTFVRGAMFRPVVVFTLFVMFGFLYGNATGGDRRVAIFESRSLLYISIVYILTTNLFTTRRQYQILLWVCFVAITIQSYLAVSYFRGLSPEQREAVESLSDHTATITMNVLFVSLIGLLLLGSERWRRALVLAMVPLVAYAYVVSQRRAAMIALLLGIVVLCVFTYFRRRIAFWIFTPTFVVLMTGWVLATWNAQGFAGLPAQSVKSVIAPEQLGEAERSSDLYRQIESYDLWFTIRAEPITGLGFGHKFYMPIRLPDISFFEFWEYLPHNAILWIWIKLGIFGFVAMLFMFARAIIAGAAAALKVERSHEVVAILAGLTFVIMYAVFAYVDIAWDARSTVFLAIAFALCADYVDAETGGRPEPSRVRLADSHFEAARP